MFTSHCSSASTRVSCICLYQLTTQGSHCLLLGIHDYYCNNGYACKARQPSKYVATQMALILESVAEGGLFLLLGIILMQIQKI